MKKCLVSGSFDPITKGHLAIIEWAKDRFDEVIVGIFVNEEKSYLFDTQTRMNLCELATKGVKNVKVIADNGMVADFCRANGICAIVRGFRNCIDYSYETEMAVYNYAHSKVPTYLIPSQEKLINVSSSLVREWVENGFCLENSNLSGRANTEEKSLNNKNSDKIQNKIISIENCLPEQVLNEIRRIKNA